MRFRDIKPYPSFGNYKIDVMLPDIENQIAKWQQELGLNMLPLFQRGHVWTEEQQIRYVEFILRDGRSGRDILFNHSTWEDFAAGGEFVCVDGLQRITAFIRFLRNEIPAFGHFYKDYEDARLMNRITLKFHVNNLPTRAEVLQWYLDLNAGGTVHSTEELDRVRLLLEEDLRS